MGVALQVQQHEVRFTRFAPSSGLIYKITAFLCFCAYSVWSKFFHEIRVFRGYSSLKWVSQEHCFLDYISSFCFFAPLLFTFFPSESAVGSDRFRGEGE